MRITYKGDYALKTILDLALHYGESAVAIHGLAKRADIPVKFLEQILLSLKRAGLVASSRGMKGGYTLIKSPDEITLGQVIRILDGPLAPIGCVSKTAYQKCGDCPYAEHAQCPLQHVMGTVRDAIAGILDHYTLDDFVSGHRKG